MQVGGRQQENKGSDWFPEVRSSVRSHDGHCHSTPPFFSLFKNTLLTHLELAQPLYFQFEVVLVTKRVPNADRIDV
jgi:hypothetical protein